MKKLLQKLGVFFLILLLIKLVFVRFYGDQFIYEDLGARVNKSELEYRKKEFAAQPFDTVFIGSSRTVFSVAPAYFDSLNHKNTKSYNFGIFSGVPPHTFDWCEELIQTKPTLKYIFFELSAGFEEPDPHENALLAFFRPSVPRTQNLKFYYGYNISLEEFINYKDTLTPLKVDSDKLQLVRSYNLQAEKKDYEANSLNEDYWNGISRLIALAESKQIHLYFYIPPRLESEKELKMIRPVYQKLEDKNKLSVRHYDESLYQIDNSIDLNHLNYKGAKKFTELMARAFDNQ